MSSQKTLLNPSDLRLLQRLIAFIIVTDDLNHHDGAVVVYSWEKSSHRIWGIMRETRQTHQLLSHQFNGVRTDCRH
jgi:hypothetical protein